LPSYVNQGINYSQGGLVLDMVYDRVGANVPDRFRKIKALQNASGAMTVTCRRAEAGDCEAELRLRTPATGPGSEKEYVIKPKGVYQGVNLPLEQTVHQLAPSFGNADAVARRCLQKNFTRRRRQIQGGVVIGEFGKTVAMVLKPARTLQSSILRFAKRTKKLVKRLGTKRQSAAKIIADHYLEATFGWSPLIADIRDGAKAVARIVTRDALERQQFRCWGNEVLPQSTSHVTGVSYAPLVFGAGTFFDVENSLEEEFEVIFYGMYASKLRRPDTAYGLCQDIIKKSGFDLNDIAPQVWELIPWSFFIDYFTNIGDLLEECANIYTDVAWVTRVTIHTTRHTRRFTPNMEQTRKQFGQGPVYPSDSWISFSGASGHSTYELKTISRSINGIDLFPREISFSLPFGRQWLNIAALAIGARPPKL
jgi:hypothetical protein